MRQTLRHHTLVIFTLLALLGQVLLANGMAMIPYAQADEMPMMQMNNGDNCHDDGAKMQSHCCDDEQNVLPLLSIAVKAKDFVREIVITTW